MRRFFTLISLAILLNSCAIPAFLEEAMIIGNVERAVVSRAITSQVTRAALRPLATEIGSLEAIGLESASGRLAISDGAKLASTLRRLRLRNNNFYIRNSGREIGVGRILKDGILINNEKITISPSRIYAVKGNRVRLRTSPGINDYNIYTTLEDGRIVLMEKEQGNWKYVWLSDDNSNWIQGWIHNTLLVNIEADQDKQEEEIESVYKPTNNSSYKSNNNFVPVNGDYGYGREDNNYQKDKIYYPNFENNYPNIEYKSVFTDEVGNVPQEKIIFYNNQIEDFFISSSGKLLCFNKQTKNYFIFSQKEIPNIAPWGNLRWAWAFRRAVQNGGFEHYYVSTSGDVFGFDIYGTFTKFGYISIYRP